MNAGRFLVVVIPLSFGAPVALAQSSPPAEKKAEAPRGEPGAATAKGVVVFIDPATGKIRQPEPAEIGALTAPRPEGAPAAPIVEPPLLMKSGPGSAVGVVLDDRFESFMVVTKGPDGRLAMECVTGGRKADAAVAAGAKPAPKSEGKEAARVP